MLYDSSTRLAMLTIGSGSMAQCKGSTILNAPDTGAAQANVQDTVNRDEFGSLSAYLYYQLWSREIEFEAVAEQKDNQADDVAKHMEGCVATMYRNVRNLDVLRFTCPEQWPPSFASGNLVLLSRTDPQLDAWKALPVHLTTTQYVEVLQPQQVPCDVLDGSWRLDVITDTTARDRLLRSLKAFSTGHMEAGSLRALIVGSGYVNHSSAFRQANQRVVTAEEEGAFNAVTRAVRLNASQQAALWGSLSHRVVLIQGPPGTGKTTTSLAVVQLQKRLWERVVFCAYTHNGCDELASRVLQAGQHLVRYGDWRRMARCYDNTVRMHSVEYKTFNELKGRFAHEKTAAYKRERKEIYKREFSDVTALHCGTLSSFGGSPIQSQLSYAFGHVEEAAQCIEPAVLPLACWCDALSLAGDPRQLPPHANSEHLQVSMMERLSHVDGMQVYCLNVQYRMPEVLIRWPNHRFYGGELQTASSAKMSHGPPRGFQWPQQAPLAFVHVATEEEEHSFVNWGEALCVAALVKKFLKEGSIPAEELGVITPYASQRTALIKTTAGKCQVGSIDAFQGQERDLIIVSLVRSNCRGSYGFLSEERRVNVALTRCRKGLIVVGNYDFWAATPPVIHQFTC